MKLYTRMGDNGFTSSGVSGGRARKDDPRLAAIGEVDALNATIGLCLAEAKRAGDAAVCDALEPVRDELFGAGASLSTGGESRRQTPDSRRPLDEAVTRMERLIDTICAELPELTDFILPGGCELSARLHLARTTARRTERAVVTAMNPTENKQGDAPVVLKYLNRLSDLLFALARLANHNSGEAEITRRR